MRLELFHFLIDDCVRVDDDGDNEVELGERRGGKRAERVCVRTTAGRASVPRRRTARRGRSRHGRGEDKERMVRLV